MVHVEASAHVVVDTDETKIELADARRFSKRLAKVEDFLTQKKTSLLTGKSLQELVDRGYRRRSRGLKVNRVLQEMIRNVRSERRIGASSPDAEFNTLPLDLLESFDRSHDCRRTRQQRIIYDAGGHCIELRTQTTTENSSW